MTAPSMKAKRVGLLRQVWNSGHRGERVVFSISIFGMASLPVYLALLILVPSSALPLPMWRELGIATSIAGFSITSVYATIFDGMMAAAYFRSLAKTAEYPSPVQKEFLYEWARAKEILGVNGQFPGSVVRGLAYTILYFGFVYGAIPFVIIAFPYLGDLTGATFAGFAIPTFVVAYVYSYRRFKGIEREATARGLRIVELRRELRPRLRPASRRRLE